MNESFSDRTKMPEVLTSAQNPKIKRLLALQQKSQERRKSGLFVVEGRRELEHCLEAGYEVETIFCINSLTPDPSPRSSLLALLAKNDEGSGYLMPQFNENTTQLVSPQLNEETTYLVSPQLYEKIAYRGSTEGVIAIMKAKKLQLEDLTLCENPLIVVLESVEKPGNLGAVLRSADAAQADAVIVCDPLTDLYNPNLIRSSIGAIFTVPTVACTSEECIRFFQERKIQILTAQLQDSKLYYDTPMTQGTAIVMGTESTGLTDQWRKAATAHIRIPMLGRLDSLNVSVSAAILLFEAVRQRQIL